MSRKATLFNRINYINLASTRFINKSLLSSATVSRSLQLASTYSFRRNFHSSNMSSIQNLNLSTAHFNPPVEGHPPTGTVPDEILPEGVKKPLLFHPIKAHPYSTDTLQLKNRVVVSPMCQYSVVDGFPTPYHIAHLGSFALHGAGTVMVEASGVSPEGRITPGDMGIYKDDHIAAHQSLVQAIKSFSPGLVMGIQLAHAGRKASEYSPFFRGEKGEHRWVSEKEGGWPEKVYAPSAIPWNEGWVTPKALTVEQIRKVEDDFVEGARRAFKAGYDFVEVHSAHGYLLHSFLSPLSNIREDNYGGSFENRTRLPLDIVKRIRKEFPNKGLWFRISSSDFAEHLHEEGKKTWDIQETKKLAKLLDAEGVDVLDCSAGGNYHDQRIKPRPGYQLDFAAEVKKLGTKMLVGAVGMMDGPDNKTGHLAEEALQQNKCDLILLARALMAHPTFAEDAGVELMGIRPAGNPQYHRVHPAKVPPPRPQNSN